MSGAVAQAEARPRLRRVPAGQIELEIEGVRVRVSRGAESEMVAAVIQALEAAW